MGYFDAIVLFICSRPRYINPLSQLLIALRFLASGSMQIVVADFAGVCTSSVCRILRRTSEAIASRRAQFIRMPQTQEEIHAARTAFWQIASMPHVIGAIDCTHIKIQSPGGDRAENFRNRKGWFSLNVQTIASANLKIISIVARWPGASHDQMIFNNSVIKMRLERGDFGDSIILGDSGYRNTNYLATPFLRCNTPEEQLFNESQIRTRNVVERKYGVWKRRFPVLSMGMRVQLPLVQDIIVACAILHNIAIDAGEPTPPIDVPGFDGLIARDQLRQREQNEQNDRDNARNRLLVTVFRPMLQGQQQE